METIFGFIAGYIAGSKDGKDGLERLRASVKAILASDEVKRLSAEAIGMAEVTVRRAASGKSLTGLSGTVGTLAEALAGRAGALGKRSRAA
jgi:hypothetical protein